MYSTKLSSTISTCVAVGYNVAYDGWIVRTTDGGATWSNRLDGSFGELAGVSCPTASTCEVAGSQPDAGSNVPTALATADGGTTWTGKYVPDTLGVFEGVSCPSPSFCLGVGDSGTVTTDDGGTHWIGYPAPAGAASLYGVACTTATLCAAVGQGIDPVGGMIVTSDTDPALSVGSPRAPGGSQGQRTRPPWRRSVAPHHWGGRCPVASSRPGSTSTRPPVPSRARRWRPAPPASR